MFESSPLPCLQSPESSFFLNGAYSVSAGYSSIMDIWNDVHLFNVNLSFQYQDDCGGILDAIFAASFGAGGALDGLNSITSTNSLGDDTTPYQTIGTTNRQILSSAQSVINSGGVTICGDYPLHTYAKDNFIISINFGKTIGSAGVFAPYIDIECVNGMSTINGSEIIGGVDFAGLGQISIYGDPLGSAEGSIEIGERYSSIRMSTISGPTGTQVVLQGFPFSGFSNVTDVYLGSTVVPFTVGSGPNASITLTIPQNTSAQTNRFLFLTQTGNFFNKFYSPTAFTVLPQQPS